MKIKNKFIEVHDMITLHSWFCLLGTYLKSHREYTVQMMKHQEEYSKAWPCFLWIELSKLVFNYTRIPKQWQNFKRVLIIIYFICLYTWHISTVWCIFTFIRGLHCFTLLYLCLEIYLFFYQTQVVKESRKWKVQK